MSEPTHRQIRAAIAAPIVAAKAGTSVQVFERYKQGLGELKKLYVADEQLIGCHIRRVSTKRTSPGLGRWHVLNRWRVTFYMAVNDEAESELAFDDWVDAVAEAFRLDPTLSQLIAHTGPSDSQNTEGLQLDEAGPVMFCGVVCHSAKATLWTQHFI